MSNIRKPGEQEEVIKKTLKRIKSENGNGYCADCSEQGKLHFSYN